MEIDSSMVTIRLVSFDNVGVESQDRTSVIEGWPTLIFFNDDQGRVGTRNIFHVN